jgi:hypothetical protein
MIGRLIKLFVVTVAPLMLLGCLLTPGKFTSALDVAGDGTFTFAYKGELIFSNNQSMMDGLESKPEFSPKCESEEDEPRECTEDEVAEQRRTFDQEAKERAEREAKERAEAAAFLGGIDPEDEASMNEFAARLQREAGWKTVTHRGKGVFDVDYEISGKLDRDFVFPVFPRFVFIVPAVVITRRDDNAALVRAPGFGDGSSPTGGMAGPMGGGSSKAEGVFTLRTDAEVATNNSEEGAVAEGNRKKLEWRVTPLNRSTPEALLRLR